jgi:GDPmannose 4,6-dehydratase
MRSMLAMEKPRDLVIATGKLTTVRSFLAMAATAAGFSPVFENSGSEEICRDGRSGAVIVSVSPKYVRPHDTPPLAGDASRLRALTGWGGSRSIEQLSTEMVAVDINRWKSGLINV